MSNNNIGGVHCFIKEENQKQQQWTISAGIKTKNASDDKSKDFEEFEEKLNSSGNFAVYFPLGKCANTSCVF
nr:2485_t:CDS:2 [Entrophospora candida]